MTLSLTTLILVMAKAAAFNVTGNSYCGEIKIEPAETDIKVKVNFISETQINIYGSVMLFDMSCKKSKITIAEKCGEDGLHDITLEEKDKGQKTCLEKQFEGVDAELSHLQIAYSKKEDNIKLMAKEIPQGSFDLTKTKCDASDMTFEDGDLGSEEQSGSDFAKWRRRLSKDSVNV